MNSIKKEHLNKNTHPYVPKQTHTQYPLELFHTRLLASSVLTNGKQTSDINSLYRTTQYLEQYVNEDEVPEQNHVLLYEEEVRKLYSHWREGFTGDAFNTVFGFADGWESLHAYMDDNYFSHSSQSITLGESAALSISMQYFFLIETLSHIVDHTSFHMPWEHIENMLQKALPLGISHPAQNQSAYDTTKEIIYKKHLSHTTHQEDIRIVHTGISCITDHLETHPVFTKACAHIQSLPSQFSDHYYKAKEYLQTVLCDFYALSSNTPYSSSSRMTARRELIDMENLFVSKQVHDLGKRKHVHFTFEQK